MITDSQDPCILTPLIKFWSGKFCNKHRLSTVRKLPFCFNQEPTLGGNGSCGCSLPWTQPNVETLGESICRTTVKGPSFTFDLTRRPQKTFDQWVQSRIPKHQVTTYPVVRAKEHEKEYFWDTDRSYKKACSQDGKHKNSKCEKKATLKEKIIWKLRKIKHKNVLTILSFWVEEQSRCSWREHLWLGR